MKNIRSYIIVDDDLLNNMICCMTIKSALGEVETKTFTVPEEGLAFIQNDFANNLQPTILFLDINMPTLTGWEFIELYVKFSEEVKNEISIYMLSSSVDHNDQQKADTMLSVKGFMTKPLQLEEVLALSGIEH